MWETLHQSVNIMIIDELVDSGLDGQGTNDALKILRHMAMARSKNVFLISHKEGLENKVDSVLTVVRENEFTLILDPKDE
jgi:energy-coupling factor transporter ATP-binding protein EcfA2